MCQLLDLYKDKKMSVHNIAQTPVAAAQLTPLADGRRLATR